MYILLIVEITAVLLLYLTSLNKFKDEINLLDIKKDRLKPLLPVGLQLLSIFRHKYRTRYEGRLEIKLRDMNGARHAHVFLKLHMAKKVVLILLASVFLTFIGTQIEADTTFAIYSIFVLLILFYAVDRQLDNALKERLRGIQLEFPEFLNKLILLVNAGLTVQSAIQKITRDSKKDNPLYVELNNAINEIGSGIPEIQAYENFAKRCRLQEVNMFTAALIQNLRKGSDQLIPILRLQSAACWENRKNIAKKLGEEASTKLMIPLVIIFIAILVMVMTPAVLQINIFN